MPCFCGIVIVAKIAKNIIIRSRLVNNDYNLHTIIDLSPLAPVPLVSACLAIASNASSVKLSSTLEGKRRRRRKEREGKEKRKINKDKGNKINKQNM